MALPNANIQQEITWTHPIGTRDGTLNTDSKMVNAYIEETEAGPVARKRAGTQYVTQTHNGTPQGQFLPVPSSATPAGFYIVNDVIYDYSGITNVPLPSASAAHLAYSIAPNVIVSGNPRPTGVFLQSSGIPIAGQQGNAYLYNTDTSAITRVTDANYPTQTVPGAAYLDNVMYVMDTGGVIHGSALNDVTTWPALDFVGCDPNLGVGIALSRHLNYIVAFLSKGIQLYSDTNAAPNGSGVAITPVPNASWKTGCLCGFSVVEMSDTTFFLAQDETFGRTIQMISGLQMTRISTTAIEKILNRVPINASHVTVNTDIVYGWAFGCRYGGHQHYVITFPDIQTTLAYDVNSQQWFQWSSVVAGVEQHFIGRFYLNDSFGDYLQDITTGYPMLLSPNVYTDVTGPINVTLVTPEYDWGTLNWKRYGAMFQIADTINTTVNVSFSDNDYQSFSIPRSVNMNTVRKMLRNCGSSRRRAWKLTHSDNTPLRLFSMKLEMTLLQR